MLQSNAEDCYLLGLQGCYAAVGVEGPNRPSWFVPALLLPVEAQQWANQTDLPCGSGNVSEAYDWDFAPEMLQQPLDVDGYQDQALAGVTAWYPSYRLLFRTGFPSATIGQDATLEVVGRATVELGELSLSRLADERLGEEGRVYVCDAGGRVLSTQWLEEALVLEPPLGQMRFRMAWELPAEAGQRKSSPAPWAKQLTQAFGGAVPTELTYNHDGVLVSVQPLPVPYSRFAVVVVAPERGPFTNPWLFSASIAAFAAAGAPYITISVISLAIFATQWWRLTMVDTNKASGDAPAAGDGYKPPTRKYTLKGLKAALAASCRELSLYLKLLGSLLAKCMSRCGGFCKRRCCKPRVPGCCKRRLPGCCKRKKKA